MEIDEEATRQLQEQPKFQMYLSWLRENGCEFPHVKWPVVFAPFGVVGASATEDLNHYDAITRISLDCIMSLDKSKQSPLGDLFASNPQIFEKHFERPYFKLTLFLMYEWGKGESGFYYPYLNQIDSPYSIAQWEEAELDELQDPVLKQKASEMKVKLKENWILLKDLIIGNPDLFPNPRKKEFIFWYMAIWTRCFGGYSLPCSMMVPFADNMNHANVQSDLCLFQRGMDETLNPQELREERSDESLPTDCKVWESGYDTFSEEDDAEFLNLEDQELEKEDDWTWYKQADPKNVYFKLTTVSGIQKDKQIFIRYGSRSNKHLLLWYGFSIPENRFDMANFRHDAFTFKLRREQFCMAIVDYYRRKILGMLQSEMVDVIAELDVEKEALDHTAYALESRFFQYPTTVEYDRKMLQKELPPRLRFALFYRISCKEILIRNLERIQAAERIVEDLMNGTEYLSAQLKEDARLLFPMREYLKKIYNRSNFEHS